MGFNSAFKVLKNEEMIVCSKLRRVEQRRNGDKQGKAEGVGERELVKGSFIKMW
jgi:hypothetical protein